MDSAAARPSRPSLRGLPSRPTPRSRSAGPVRSQQDLPPRPGSAASERPSDRPSQLRPQRSVGNLSSGAAPRSVDRHRRFEKVPPLPPLPLDRLRTSPPVPNVPTNAVNYRALRKGPKGSNASAASVLSPSSSVSSSATGSPRSSMDYASSATSLDEGLEDMEGEKEGEKEYVKPPPGFGSSLWGRVAVVAGSLTVSVAKAWETNVATYSGEITPPGQESRLMRAMKSYHISKARDPTDLPEWLFEERERGVAKVLPRDSREGRDDLPEAAPAPKSKAPTPVSPRRMPSAVASPVDDSAVPASKAARRLWEITNAKRNARVRFVDGPHPRHGEADGNGIANPTPVPMPDVKAAEIPRPVQPSPRRAPVLASVDLRGKRPAAGGLPSGVRPRRGV